MLSTARRTPRSARRACALHAALALLCALPFAASATSSGKLLATQGVNTIEGAAGAGISTWSVITGYDSAGQIGANAFATEVRTKDFGLTAFGAAVGIDDRVELSLARQRFDTRDVGATLGLGRGYAFGQTVAGVKVRVAGDAVLDQDRWLPQIAVGAQFKRADHGALLSALGARSDHDVDAYVSASKLLLEQSLFVGGAVRWTRANEFGLLGFGGPRQSHARPELEGTAAALLRRDVAVGVEWRTKPDALGLGEQRALDVFGAWFVDKHLSLTIAFVDLGRIVVPGGQRGVYGSVQVGF